MPRPSRTWLITDTHFYHKLMVELCGRPTNFNELILKNLRHLVAKQDTLIHLGDVIFYKYPELKGMLDSVPCRKFLMMGNHDHKSKGWYMRNGFDCVSDQMVWGNVLFSHRPLEKFPSGVVFNVHGHFHNIGHRKAESWYDTAVYKVLAIENTEYKPVLLSQFLPEADVSS